MKPTAAPPVESRAAKMIREIFESGRPLTYIRSAEEQRVGRVLREVSLRADAAEPVPVWTWSLTEGMRRDEGAAEARHAGAPRGAGLHRRATRAPPSSTSRTSTSRCGNPRRSGAACGTSTRAVSTSGSSWSSARRCDSFRRNSSAACCFVDLRPPDLVELADSCGTRRSESRRTGAREPSDEVFHQLARALQGLTLDEARYALRRALAAQPAAGARIAAGACSKRSGCWSTAAGSSSTFPTAPSIGESAAWRA